MEAAWLLMDKGILKIEEEDKTKRKGAYVTWVWNKDKKKNLAE